MSDTSAADLPALRERDAAALLAGLAPAAWARLLAALRRHATDRASDPPAWVADLAAPTSELTQGRRRRALCERVAADVAGLVALAADETLPAEVREALAARPAANVSSRGASDVRAVDDGRERERDLRRELDVLRRQRDGAVARAQSAEARVAAAEEEVARLRTDADRHRASDATVEETVARAVARTERRLAARIELLEASLAEERASAERSRRADTRNRAQLAELGAELATLRSERDQLAPHTLAAASPGGRRPLRLPPTLDPLTTDGARWLIERAEQILLDGYNITLTQRPGEELESQRRWLIERVRFLADRGSPAPIIVFDGDRPSGSLRRTPGVEVRFTGVGVSADDEIVFAVAATDRPVIAVTDDRELRARVEAEGGNVLAPVAFLAALEP